MEDDALIRLILSESLTDQGYQVVEAGTGDEALSLIDGPDGFDVVVTDIQMPGRANGLEVGAHARRRHSDIPIVYVTGRPESLTGVSLGPCDAIVRKPYGPTDMLATISGMLRTHEP